MDNPEHDDFEPSLPRQTERQPHSGWRSLADLMAEIDEERWAQMPVSSNPIGRPDRMMLGMRGESESHERKRKAPRKARPRKSPTTRGRG
jgi:hypothetical protein